ncbi:MAG: HAMP domain-containing sensor histidine kinase, partial [Bacteroidia bacterium]|nr:HAMP domain-containing sensor histidine kinase [Bacteroidia bacterium]
LILILSFSYICIWFYFPIMKDKTYFAPAERTNIEKIRAKSAIISSLAEFKEVFGAINAIGAVLDNNRQVVYASNDIIKTFGFNSIEDLLGKRPGEAISCLHSADFPAGCGTSMACSVCGAVNAIMESQKTGVKSTKEASITTVIDGHTKSYVLRVTSSPIILADEQFYLLILEDVSNEKRRATLERIFFHDILNTAGSLNGLLEVLKKETDPAEARKILNISEETSRNLVEEIMLQRQIRAAENGDLEVKFEKLNSTDVLYSAISKIKFHDSAKDRIIIIDKNSVNMEFESDRILIQRILINLLKNALEATDEGGTINAGCKREGQKTSFWVQNATVIPGDVQLQIFQRAFSTKGKGRGIGTYSIKLLTENYLKGKVRFLSNEEGGTVFTVTV